MQNEKKGRLSQVTRKRNKDQAVTAVNWLEAGFQILLETTLQSCHTVQTEF